MAYLLDPGSHIDVPLSNYIGAYRPLGSIADFVSPPIPVKRRSDKFYTWDKAALLGHFADDHRRARGANPRLIEPTVSVDGYLAVEHELATGIEDADLANTDSVIQLEQSKTQFVADVLRGGRELRVASQLRLTSTGGQLTLGTTDAGATQWDNAGFTASALITQIKTGIEAVRTVTGYKPNTIIIPAAVAAVAVTNSTIQSLIQYLAGVAYVRDFQVPLGGNSSGFGGGNPNQNGSQYQYFPDTFLGLKVWEPGMVYNTAAEGLTGSYSDVWGKHVRILYVNPNPPNMEIPSCMYTFRSTEFGTAGWNVRRWRDDGPKMNMYGVGVVETDKVVATDLGYVIENVIS